MRKKMVVIVARVNGLRSVHFTKQPISGENNNLWIPIYDADLFRAVENILIANNVAHNLVCMSQLRMNCEDSYDYEALYNASEVAA